MYSCSILPLAIQAQLAKYFSAHASKSDWGTPLPSPPPSLLHSITAGADWVPNLVGLTHGCGSSARKNVSPSAG